VEGWRGESTLILAPTGTGKTLTAFLWCLDHLMLQTGEEPERGCRVVYLSPLKALAAGRGAEFAVSAGGHREYGRSATGVSVQDAGDQRADGDTSPKERARFRGIRGIF
jgi:ATP-dependent Lhr-like helicase